MPLALTGMVLGLRRVRALGPLYLFAGIYAATTVLFFITMRYRLPIVVALFPFAGFALVELLARIRARTARSWGPAALTVAASLAIVHLPIARGEIAHDLAYTYDQLGNLRHNAGSDSKALAFHQRAVELYPEGRGLIADLGQSYLDNDQPERAVEALTRAVALGDVNPPVYRSLGEAYRAVGRMSEAVDAYRKALEMGPRHVPTRIGLAIALEALGRSQEAAEELARAIDLEKDPAAKTRLQAKLDALGAAHGKAPPPPHP